MITTIAQKIFGTKNGREVKRYAKRVAQINDLEPKYEALSDDELKQAFNDFKAKIQDETLSLNDVTNDVFAIVREASKRTIGLRHFDVQMIGGLVLNDGKIAEMKTGEGKTLVATLPVVLNAMSGKGVHVVTVNDYLASRDATDMGKVYNFLGLSVGVVVGGMDDDTLRKAQYNADITYGTNNEYGFDYLRDNMKYSIEEKVQREHNFVIVDEVDSILIDEARTPLIISGPTNRTLDSYTRANEVALQLVRGKAAEDQNPAEGDFSVDEKNKTILMNEDGITKAEELFGVDNLYSVENAILSHHLDQALKAQHLFEKDVDYVVRDGEVIIVDEFTGRLSEGRRFSEGLHQALEAKEGVKIQEESQTLADITFQNYFRMYDKLAGMTGTAQTEATEFSQIYSLDVLSIPTNVPVIREDCNDLIYKTEVEKFRAVIDEIKQANKKGQPVLVGTASIEKSEFLHSMLKKEKIAHSVLNAKNHEKEAQIILNAGVKGAVTIATNMAGRGVDIKINDEIKKLGGLYIIGTERHESRRIDNQLRGRSGRQGDPGKSRFYLSLEDNLLRIFGSDKIKSIMDRLGIEEGESIDSKMVTRAVENAQKKVENLHFESRKHILEYDDVANEQRKTIYKYRNDLLNPDFDIASKIDANRSEYVSSLLFNAEIYDGSLKEEYNLEKLCNMIKEDMSLNIKQSTLENLEFDELKHLITEKLSRAYEQKMFAVDPKQKSEIERYLYLQILDNSWREHMYQMDILKTGIGLRGYNQKDPLTEYKKESYNLFMELVETLKIESVKTLQIVQLQSQTSLEEEQAKMQKLLEELEKENLKDIKLEHESSLEPKENKPVIKEKKVPRNSPCPCGSGKKYKSCCGVSGPKKGAFA